MNQRYREKITSFKNPKGVTPTERALIIGATADTAAPSASNDGIAAYLAQNMHLVATAHGTQTCTLVVWFYLAMADKWVQSSLSLGIGPSETKYLGSPINGIDRLYIQVTATATPSASGVDVWVGGNTY